MFSQITITHTNTGFKAISLNICTNLTKYHYIQTICKPLISTLQQPELNQLFTKNFEVIMVIHNLWCEHIKHFLIF